MQEFDFNQPKHFKAQVRASFDKTLSTYGTNGDFHWQFAARLIEHSPLQERQTLLDIGTGTAPAAVLAAHHVGSSGQIVGLDLSPGILKIAKEKITTFQLTNVRLLCGDAENLPFAEKQFNGVLCSSAIVWLPNIPGALEEWYRVLRPCGWLAFSCVGGLGRQITTEIMNRLLQRYGKGIPELNGRLNTAEKCQRLLDEAGFIKIQISTTGTHKLFDTPEEGYRQSEAGRDRFNITLTPQQERQLKADYIAELERISSEQDQWNRDYEQFVVAYKPS